MISRLQAQQLAQNAPAREICDRMLELLSLDSSPNFNLVLEGSLTSPSLAPVPAPPPMSDEDIERLADRVHARLREPMISAVIPAGAAELIRRNTPAGSRPGTMTFPLSSADWLAIEYSLNMDGSLQLRLVAGAGEIMWQGVLRAAG